MEKKLIKKRFKYIKKTNIANLEPSVNKKKITDIIIKIEKKYFLELKFTHEEIDPNNHKMVKD